jgi:hypothetical protein
MVRISVFVGIIIELWKVPKILNFQVYIFSIHQSYHLFVIHFSDYLMKHGLVSYQNINMFINNRIKIPQHRNMIELVHHSFKKV